MLCAKQALSSLTRYIHPIGCVSHYFLKGLSNTYARSYQDRDDYDDDNDDKISLIRMKPTTRTQSSDALRLSSKDIEWQGIFLDLPTGDVQTYRMTERQTEITAGL